MAKQIAKKARKGARRTASAAARKAPARTPGRKTAAKKYVYFFGGGTADGDRTMKDLLGGKGATWPR